MPTLGHFPLSQESNVIATNKSSNIGVDTLSTSYLFLSWVHFLLHAGAVFWTSCDHCMRVSWAKCSSFYTKHFPCRVRGISFEYWCLCLRHPCIYHLLIISTKICLQCKSYLWLNVSCRGVPCLTYFSVVICQKQGLLCNIW